MKKNQNMKKTTILGDADVKQFITILLVVILIVIGLYFVSKFIVDNRDSLTDNESVAGEIDYSVLTVGTLLNRPYDEYYVLAYHGSKPEALLYSALISNYQASKDSIKIYYCDLDNELNKKYVVLEDEKSNPKAENIEQLKLGEITLIKVENQKITKYIEDLDEIKSTLK